MFSAIHNIGTFLDELGRTLFSELQPDERL